MTGPEGGWTQRAAETYEQMVQRHNAELHDLLEWRNELRGAFGLVRLAIGSSVLSALVMLASLWQLASK